MEIGTYGSDQDVLTHSELKLIWISILMGKLTCPRPADESSNRHIADWTDMEGVERWLA